MRETFGFGDGCFGAIGVLAGRICGVAQISSTPAALRSLFTKCGRCHPARATQVHPQNGARADEAEGGSPKYRVIPQTKQAKPPSRATSTPGGIRRWILRIPNEIAKIPDRKTEIPVGFLKKVLGKPATPAVAQFGPRRARRARAAPLFPPRNCATPQIQTTGDLMRMPLARLAARLARAGGALVMACM